MAAADALLDALRVPGQIVIDDKGAELEVDAFGGGFSRKQDVGVLPELLDQGGADVHSLGAGELIGAGMVNNEAVVGLLGAGVSVGAIEGDDLPAIAVGLEVAGQECLGCRPGEDWSTPCGR
jgi:hypothetical protein